MVWEFRKVFFYPWVQLILIQRCHQSLAREAGQDLAIDQCGDAPPLILFRENNMHGLWLCALSSSVAPSRYLHYGIKRALIPYRRVEVEIHPSLHHLRG